MRDIIKKILKESEDDLGWAQDIVDDSIPPLNVLLDTKINKPRKLINEFGTEMVVGFYFTNNRELFVFFDEDGNIHTDLDWIRPEPGERGNDIDVNTFNQLKQQYHNLLAVKYYY